MTFHVRTKLELENAIYDIYENSRSAAVAPYYKFNCEYRAIVVSKEVALVYEKQRPTVVGDGHSSVKRLVTELMQKEERFSLSLKQMASLEFKDEEWNSVPRLNEKVLLNWRHNLAFGAKPNILEVNNKYYGEIRNLALEAAGALDLRVGSVDIVTENGTSSILEVNTGLMLDAFFRMHRRGPDVSTQIIRNLIDSWQSAPN